MNTGKTAGCFCGAALFALSVLAEPADIPDNAFGFARPGPGMAVVLVDPAKELGPIRPVNGVNNGPIRSRNDQCFGTFEHFRNARIPSARPHDSVFCAGYGGPHTIDISSIFPDFDADENDPRSYDFHWTDEYLESIVAAGTEVYYRLGQSIEHGGKKYHIWPPKDFHKWARVCEHLIRHVNEGWGNGTRLGVRHWEIWNEADNNPTNNPTCWGGTDEQFFEFFAIAARHLKGTFPALKIGGPAVGWNEKWAERFLAYSQAHGVPLDFFSWHGYARDPRKVGERARRMRTLMNRYGYDRAESHMTEWNYVKGWSEEWVYSMRAISGDLAEIGSAYAAATLIELQDSGVDLAHYYDARPGTSMNGLFDFITGRPLKGYYPFYAWSRLRDFGTQVAARAKSPDGDVSVIAAVNSNGETGVLIARFAGDGRNCAPIVVKLRFADGTASAVGHLTDYASLYTEFPLVPDGDGLLSFRMEPNSFAMITAGIRHPLPGK